MTALAPLTGRSPAGALAAGDLAAGGWTAFSWFRRRLDLNGLVARATLLVLLLVGAIMLAQIDVSPSAILASRGNAVNFFHRVKTLDFPPLGDLAYQTALTLGIVVTGTLLAGLISLPVAYLAAANTSPGRVWRVVGRFIGVFCRALPDVVLAMVFALICSLGALPGILAIAIHSVGMISRLFADAVEQIDQGPLLAIRAAGGSRAQEFFSGVLPQVFPSWCATVLHRADINLRGSVILGYVAVPGLGLQMRNAFATLDYGRGLAVAVVIFGLCVGMEALSSSLRRRLLSPADGRRPVGSPRRSGPTGRRPRAALVPSASVAARTASIPAAPGSATPVPAVSATSAAAPGSASPAQLAAWLRRPWTAARLRSWIGRGVGVGVLVASVWVCQITWSDLWTSWGRVPRVADSFWPPTAGNYGLPRLLEAMGQTVAVALAAAVITLVGSWVVGSLAARNVAPNGGVRTFCRLLLVAIRGVPELVLAIVLIIVTGLGSQAGVLALGLCHIGLLGKLMADSLEEVPHGPERALTAAGASRAQVYLAATLPQSRRAIIGHICYVLDTNLRAATILGLVGGGGIGYYLLNASQGSNYGLVALIVGMIVAVVMALEGLTMWCRAALR
ncbi:MAG: ABC transporter permease subunit [Propionibacteriaceae bacterium]|jgi:phosphonate transport system permease protein|nr:ABC transporter permease subunit [Propionibacteriaceae bacterium]